MKKFAVNFAFYYITLSLIIGIFWILTGYNGNFGVRILTSSALAFFNPIFYKENGKV